ncbi:sulfur acclimation 1 protein [Volvox carteri f. nagariensis]|uniref:Sulfur acclimation 1 protein n=2 Tax=Volvox carteri f. nagariensis TaxID=3068 RepID=D8TSN9_VOLCA|nr:sulfur acclimation 1 protein [Volvox carteri f. nagariensis]EFJ49404.1 sulfur acclimation 1 protein [Volvox carteri f. nagariensis]|eukprot:XP_002949385.1 sulfur acclimation 1 protein [Volvox carteri f. nagariensis]
MMRLNLARVKRALMQQSPPELPPASSLSAELPLRETSTATVPDTVEIPVGPDSKPSKPSLLDSPDLRELFSRHVWRRETKRRLKRLRPKEVWHLIKEERWTILATVVFAAALVALELTAWRDMSPEAWFTLWVTFFSIVPMIRGVVDPDVCLFAGATVLLLRGVITPRDAFAGLANDSIVSIALMMMIAAGLESSGALEFVPELVLGRSRREWVGQLRLHIAVASVSAVMNNTPLVAVMIPVVEAWCRQNNHNVSRFMMPLSYAAILGGLCTIIGTSTNLIARGLAQQEVPELRIPFVEIGVIGLPLTVAGGLYIVLFSPLLLPKREPMMASVVADPREYVVSVRVDSRYAHIGRTIEAAGLRHLRGLFLADLQRRDGTAVPSPPPTTIILQGDKLTFAGDITGMQHILTLPGLNPISSSEVANDFEENAASRGVDRVMVEAVVALSSPIVNMTIRDSHFRSRYGAVVLAVHRNGERIMGGLGDIVVKGGDTMLLEASPDFLEKFKHSSEWALAVDAFRVSPPRRDPVALFTSMGIFVAMVVLNSMDLIPLATSALVCLFAYLVTGVLTVQKARNAIPGGILLTVAGAFGMARGLTVTGLADRLAASLLSCFKWMGRADAVSSVYVTTSLLTALLSNGAAITLMFPIALTMSKQAGISFKGPLYAIMVGASSDFSTPIGYQTNLMVSGPGGYRFLDYTRFGLPLQLIAGLITVPVCVLYFG